MTGVSTSFSQASNTQSFVVLFFFFYLQAHTFMHTARAQGTVKEALKLYLPN